MASTARHTSLFVPEPVAAWRFERLRAAGASRTLAARIATDGRYDVHALIDLVERGCPPELAARIVAPLETAEPTR